MPPRLLYSVMHDYNQSRPQPDYNNVYNNNNKKT